MAEEISCGSKLQNTKLKPNVEDPGKTQHVSTMTSRNVMTRDITSGDHVTAVRVVLKEK